MKAGSAALAVTLACILGCAGTRAGSPAAAGLTKATARAGLYSTDPDPVTGARWVKPLIADRPGTGYYLYFPVERDQKKGELRAVFEALSERWIAADRVVVRVDGTAYEVPIPPAEWRRGWVEPSEPGRRGVLCSERADLPLGATHPELVAAMCAARKVVVRFVGQDQVTIDPQNPVFVASLRAVCEAYGPPPRAPAAPLSGARTER